MQEAVGLRWYRPNVAHGSDYCKTSCAGVPSILTDTICGDPNEKGGGTWRQAGRQTVSGVQTRIFGYLGHCRVCDVHVGMQNYFIASDGPAEPSADARILI